MTNHITRYWEVNPTVAKERERILQMNLLEFLEFGIEHLKLNLDSIRVEGDCWMLTHYKTKNDQTKRRLALLMGLYPAKCYEHKDTPSALYRYHIMGHPFKASCITPSHLIIRTGPNTELP